MTVSGRDRARYGLRLSYIPNLICVFRIVLVWPIVVSLLEQRYVHSLLLIALAGFSDGLDGFLAKRFDWRTRLGGLLDPIADKLLLVSTFLTLTVTGLVPVWLTAVVILRDVTIVSGGLAYHALVAPVQAAPSPVSKINTGAQLLFLLGVIANHAFGMPPREITLFLGALVLVTSVVSGLDYVIRWSRKALTAA